MPEKNGPPPQSTPPRLDTSAIAFPTDAITLAQMRRREPGLFDRESLTTLGASDIDAVATHCYELILAEKAFARALSLDDPAPGTNRSELVDVLSRAYKEYGLSSGVQQTQLLARDIEAAATTQAQNIRGRSR